jgi:hypothetical protein
MMIKALVDVCNKAKSLILTASKAEAEFELKWLAKDKAHYDLLANQELERHQDGIYI